MKINDTNTAGLGSQGIGRAQETEQGAHVRQGRKGEAGASSTDQVQLSGLSEVLRAAGSESPDRAQHLESLRADVEKGRYQVDSGELSKKIVDSAITDA